MVIIALISILLVVTAFVYLAVRGAKEGLFDDKNNNNIPDVVEDKAKAIKKEVKDRVREVTKEVADVKNAVKEVGKQASHIPGAVAGKKRSGRKNER